MAAPRQHPSELSNQKQLEAMLKQIALANGGTLDGLDKGPVEPTGDTPIPTAATAAPAVSAQYVPPAPPPAQEMKPGDPASKMSRPMLEDAQPIVVTTRLSGSVMIGDLVQVLDPKLPNRIYGITFIVGGIKGGNVHGFTIRPGGGKEFFTVPEASVHSYGESQVKARVATSPEWEAGR